MKTKDLEGLARRTNGLEKIDHPEHYRKDSGFEVIDIIESWSLGFHLGNALKYIARAGLKTEDKREDIEKAIWYLKRYLEDRGE